MCFEMGHSSGCLCGGDCKPKRMKDEGLETQQRETQLINEALERIQSLPIYIHGSGALYVRSEFDKQVLLDLIHGRRTA